MVSTSNKRSLPDPRIHVCILTSVHPIDDIRVYHKFARTFVREGFRVTWVGPDWTFADLTARQEHGIDFRLFPHANSKLGRLLAYPHVYRKARELPDVDVFYAPEPDSALAAVRLAARKRCRAIFDIHEMYHGAMLHHWVKGPLGRVAGSILYRQILCICSRCDLVVGVSRAVLEPFRQMKTESLVLRSCAPAYFSQGPPAEVCHPTRSTFTVMHGKADLYRGTATVLEALHLAKQQLPQLRSIMFDKTLDSNLGFGKEAFLERVAGLQLADVVDLRAAVSLREMPAILRTCDAGLIAYGRRLGTDSLPNRLFEYMAAGLPVIAPTYSPEICRILREEKCGVTADFEDPSSIAAALVTLSQNPEQCRQMGQRARQAFEKRHNWEVEVRPLLSRIRSWASPEATEPGSFGTGIVRV